MEQRRLWYVKRGERVQGPFPEALVCSHIALGRINSADVLSLDGHFWRPLKELPELVAAVDRLLHQGADEEGVNWREERAKAALRWLDDRKSPDPRSREHPEHPSPFAERRSGNDRRETPETVEDHVYRENRFQYETWVRERRERFGKAMLIVLGLVLVVLLGVVFMKPVNPIKVGLKVHASDCAAPAGKGVAWNGCKLDGFLLVGADLRAAELMGASLRDAKLRYADLTGANLQEADLTGADLTGARLGGAIWTDGRVCAAASVGLCL